MHTHSIEFERIALWRILKGYLNQKSYQGYRPYCAAIMAESNTRRMLTITCRQSLGQPQVASKAPVIKQDCLHTASLKHP